MYYVQKFLFVDPGIAYGPAKSVEALFAPDAVLGLALEGRLRLRLERGGGLPELEGVRRRPVALDTEGTRDEVNGVLRGGIRQ